MSTDIVTFIEAGLDADEAGACAAFTETREKYIGGVKIHAEWSEEENGLVVSASGKERYKTLPSKSGVWTAGDHDSVHGRVVDGDGEVVVYDEGSPSCQQAQHIARWDPARVLREVAAKRALLADHFMDSANAYICECRLLSPDARQYGYYDADADPCRTILALASVYSDQPDFDPSWAVTA